MTAALLRVEALVAGYGRAVVGPLSFEVRAGEILGLRGPNGCGKSTLLNAIAGRADVLDGQIQPMPRLRLAYQTQQSVRLPIMPITGRELLGVAGASCAGLPTELDRVLGTRLDRLSGGQLQLLHVWAALASPADLVMLDEPTNNLDPSRERMLAGMLTGWRRGAGMASGHRAALLVSHEEAFLTAVCSRIIEIG